MLETTARSALCLRCTNCLRQYCFVDFFPDLIKFNLKIRQDSDAHIRQWIIWRRTEWLNKDAMSGESKCGLQQLTSWRRLIPSPQFNLGRPQIQWYRAWVHQPREKIVQKPKRYCNDRQREWHVRDQKGDQAGWYAIELALQHCSTGGLERWLPTMAKETRNGHLLWR